MVLQTYRHRDNIFKTSARYVANRKATLEGAAMHAIAWLKTYKHYQVTDTTESVKAEIRQWMDGEIPMVGKAH